MNGVDVSVLACHDEVHEHRSCIDVSLSCFQMSGNLISTFEAVDGLKPLGSLTCLYLEHNPLYK